MDRLHSHLRRWGNSLGLVIPSPVIQKEGLEEGSPVVITIQPEEQPTAAAVFGILPPTKKTTTEMLAEADRELWPDG